MLKTGRVRRSVAVELSFLDMPPKISDLTSEYKIEIHHNCFQRIYPE
jgi:hypothetical protein